MSVDLSVVIREQKSLEQTLDKLSGKEAAQGYASALNDTGHQTRRFLGKELRERFDRPTPFIYNSPKFVPATPDKLSISVLPTLDARNLPSRGGKVGVDPQQVLQAQAYGGSRADKRSEIALRRAGILPAGFQTAIPGDEWGGPFPGSDDGRGNIRGPFMAQLISYLQASGEQGYRANMKAKAKAKIEDRTRYSQLSNRKEVSLTRGRVYFVSRGIPGGSHLPPGIWAKTGTHGAEVKPVLMFTRPRKGYTPRIDLDRVVERADLQNYLDRRVRFRIREIAGE